MSTTEITTYEELLDSIEVKEIIITNLITREGYVRYQKNYSKLYSKTHPRFDIKKGNSLSCIIDSTLMPINKGKTLKDIIEKTYTDDSKLYSFKYNEYCVDLSLKEESGDAILDTKTFTFEYSNTDKVFASNYYGNSIELKTEIDTTIINKLLTSYVNRETIKNFKYMCYNIFVEDDKQPYILHDYSNKDEYNLCTYIKEVALKLRIGEVLNCYYSMFSNKYEMYNSEKEVTPRVIIFDKNVDEKVRDRVIKKYKELGCTKYIISHEIYKYSKSYYDDELDHKSNYDVSKLSKQYITSLKEIDQYHIDNCREKYKQFDGTYSKEMWTFQIENLFEKENYFFIEMLKLMCTK